MNEYNKQYADKLKKERKYKELFDYLSAFAESDIPQALNFLSKCYYNGYGTDKNYNKCFELDLRAADYNDPDAIAALGVDYEYGVGTKKDVDKAINLYTKASNMCSAKGTTLLAQCYEDGIGVEKDEAKAFGLYVKIAETGYSDAQRLLGQCYEYGIGTDVDEKKAFEMYKSAAEQDSAIAQRLLGQCYEYGTGTNVDKEKAVKWYRESSEQKNKIAQYMLAMCYAYGEGVEKDETRAFELCYLSAEAGCTEAQRILAWFYECGNGVEKNLEHAIKWYMKAIEKDDRISMVQLACIYFDHFDDEAKDKIAFDYLQKAVNELDKNSYHYYLACFKLAGFYDNGYLVETDPVKAFDYCKIAAEGGLEYAFNVLAKFYAEGIGTQVDKKEAIYWYEKELEYLVNDMDKAESYLTIGDLLSDISKVESNGYYKNAYDIYDNEANNGNAEALLKLADLFFEGKGVKKDYQKTFICFEKASIKLDDGRAEYGLANCYLRGIGVKKDVKKAFKLLQKISNSKNPIVGAKILIIYCYINGVGTRKKIKKAKKLMDLLYAESEFARQYIDFYRGIMFYHGIGEEKNIERALKCFKKSPLLCNHTYIPICEGNYKYAVMLGVIYSSDILSKNLLILRDDKLAEYFLRLAYDNNVIGSAGINMLCKLMRNKRKTYDILTNAFLGEMSDAKSERLLGEHLYYGCGCKKNINEAIKYFSMANEKGDDIAGIYLAYCYAYGKGVEKNYETAKSFLKNSCNNGDNTAKVLLGVLIYSGDWGLKNNKTEGLKLINEGSKISLFKMLYEMISGKRGEFYKKIFLEMIFAQLHVCFSQKKRYYISSAMKLFFLMLTKNPYSENLTKKEMLRILLSQNEMLIEQSKGIEESQIDINSVVNQIRTNTDKIPQIIEQQKELMVLVNAVIDYVTEEKRNLPAENSLRFLDKEQLEQIQARFIEGTAEKIVTSLQEKSVSVEREEAFLKGMFGDYWEELDGYTRKSLLSARVLFENCKGPEFSSLDHSGVVISATSALENEIKRRIFTGYQMFLKKELGLPSKGGWPELMVFHNKNGDVVENKNLTLGSLPYLFDCSDEDKQLFLKYLKKILSEKYVDSGMSAFLQKERNKESFVMRCEKVRKSYRNIAAHTGLVERAKAEACCNDIIGPNEASKKIGQVQGLLYDLVQMTENFSKL